MKADTIAVSVVVPVYNEQANIGRCLEHLGRFAEVIVVDSGSTDCTRDIALSYGAKVLDFVWNGKFPKKRNWCLRNYRFANPWVLFVDADECVTNDFQTEISRVLPHTHHAGFLVTYQNYFMGRLLKHGDMFRKLSLLRIGAGEYERINENQWSNLDMEIHEHPVLNGSVGRIKSPIIHEDFKGLKAYISRHNEYSSWEACRYFDVIERQETSSRDLTLRQRLKYRFLDTWLLGCAYFFVSYVIKLGFLDGLPGFIFATLKMYYFFQIKCKINEARMSSRLQQDNNTKAQSPRGKDTPLMSRS